MKLRYGDGFKRNIRFEDGETTLVIDMLIPGGKNEWVTVGYERALQDRKTNNREKELDQGDKLSSRSETGANREQVEPTNQGSGSWDRRK